MTEELKLDLQKKACQVRMGIIASTHSAKAGHPGGSLSAAEMFTYLYNRELRVDPADPKNENRDRFVLSKGHTAPGLYSALAYRGFFPVEDLLTLRHIGSYLQGHPNMNTVPGVDMSTGSLGQGLSAAVGMALAGKADGRSYRVYALMGDGELEEGQIWEAAMAAAKFKLDNLCAVVDVNGLQIDGATADVMPSEPLDKKWAAFGWNVIACDGHDYAAIERAFAKAAAVKGQPSVILARTVKGKGVSLMENNAGWHGKAPNEEQYHKAHDELGRRIMDLAWQAGFTTSEAITAQLNEAELISRSIVTVAQGGAHTVKEGN